MKQTIEVDLQSPRSIDAAVGQIGGEMPKIFVCAGVPGPPRFDALTTMTVNFVGVRQIIEALLPKVPSGGAVALIGWMTASVMRRTSRSCTSSVRQPPSRAPSIGAEGREPGHRQRLPRIEAGADRVHEAARVKLVAREIRLNALLPSPTDTPMLPQFYAQAGGQENLDKFFQAPIGSTATAARDG